MVLKMVIDMLLNGCKGIAANVPMLYEGGEIDAHLVSLAQMTNSSTTIQLRNAAPLLYSGSGLCVVALSRNLKLTTTLDRAITQNPCYVPLNCSK